jgi:hypothetical protein
MFIVILVFLYIFAAYKAAFIPCSPPPRRLILRYPILIFISIRVTPKALAGSPKGK